MGHCYKDATQEARAAFEISGDSPPQRPRDDSEMPSYFRSSNYRALRVHCRNLASVRFHLTTVSSDYNRLLFDRMFVRTRRLEFP